MFLRSAWQGFSGFAWPIVLDYFLAVELKRELIVRNVRIAIFYKITQVLVLFGLFLYIIAVTFWASEIGAVLYSAVMWPEAIYPEQATRALQKGYCDDSGSYAFRWMGHERYDYKPQRCQQVAWGEGWLKEGDRLVLFTFNEDNDTVFEEDYSGSCLAGREACVKNRGVFSLQEHGCVCRRESQHFVAAAETAMVHFIPGFKFITPLGVENKVTINAEDDGEVRTTIVDRAGEPCPVQGKAVYEEGEVDFGAGIQGTLQEFLHCANWTIDEDAGKRGKGNPALTRLRLMGAQLIFELHVTNQLRRGKYDVLVRPRVSPVWTTVFSRETHQNPRGEHTRTRVAHGLLLKFEVSHNLRFFSLQFLLDGTVNVLFFLLLTRLVVEFMIIYFLGNSSHVYRNAKRTRFNIQEQARTGVAKALMPMVAFRGLVGGRYDVGAEELPQLSADDLKRHVEDMLADAKSSEALEDVHINRAVLLLCESRVGSHDFRKELSYKDFEAICNLNDEVREQELFTMMHVHRRRGLLERVVDETDRDIDRKVFAQLTDGSRSSLFRAPDQDLAEAQLRQLWDSLESGKQAVSAACSSCEERALVTGRAVRDLNSAATQGLDIANRTEAAVKRADHLGQLLVAKSSLHLKARAEGQQRLLSKLGVQLKHAESTTKNATEAAYGAVYSCEAAYDTVDQDFLRTLFPDMALSPPPVSAAKGPPDTIVLS